MLLFIGAGASKQFEIPDTKGFINDFESEDIIGKNEIYQRIKNSISGELFDMEIIMTILDDLSKSEQEILGSIAPYTTQFLLKQETEVPD